MLSVVRSLIWIPTTFILSSTRFRCSSINGGHSASSRLRRFPTGVSCHQSPGTWLVTDFFHSLYNAIPVFIDYYRISTVGTNFIPSPRGYPRSSNRYYMNRHHTMHSYACKKFDPVGVIRILVCELPYWVIWVEYLCFSFPMYLLLWANHQHVINIHLHVEKLSVRDIPYSFFFPKPHSYHHHAVFHRILTRQGRVDAHTLVRWTHSAFRAYGVPTQALFQQWLLDRMAYAIRKSSGIQPMVTVQCFTAF